MAIPVPGASIPLEVVDAAREMVKYNGQPAKTGRRFWEIPGGAVRCGGCGNRMLKYASMAGGRVYAYYKCSRLVRNGKDACSPERRRTLHRAEELEGKVWELISGLLKDPDRIRAGLERMIDIERSELRGEPERSAKAWADTLVEVQEERRGYLRLAAKGRMTDEDLDVALAELEEARRAAKRGLAAAEGRRERIEQLERDKDAILQRYAGLVPEALDDLAPEECHRVYKMLRLDVLVHPDETTVISGVFGEAPLFSNQELVPRYRP